MTTTAPNSLQQVMDSLGFEYLSEEEQETLLVDVNEMIFKNTLVRLLEHMDAETQDAFSDLVESDQPEEEIIAFLEQHIPNATKVIQTSVQEVTNDILAASKE